MATLEAGSSAISIAVPQWDVALRAHALLSESPQIDDVKATFDLRITSANMNALFEWNGTTTDGYLLKFQSGASTSLTTKLQQQVYLPPGVARLGESVSLSTHFLCSQSDINFSTAMTSQSPAFSTTKINMIEEKILAVSTDIFNSTSAFTLFQPDSRLLLANDYYNLGYQAYDYLIKNKFTPAVATGIYQNLVSYRQTTTGNTYFGEFIDGDVLTFNVVAISSEQQYEIIPIANRNYMDRSYKFRIVADNTVTITDNVSNKVGASTPPFLGQQLMGYGTTTQYMSIFTTFPDIERSTVGSTAYIDSNNGRKNYNTSYTTPDGSIEF
jgi:hypothetical protein